jgi:D-beta-D-heptose 7-phosphate kinase/D-beta-D-heptose 1-phosphate adenosyltransferase
MQTGLSRLPEAFSGLRVLVVGDAMLDRYTQGVGDRICPDAPALVMQIRGRRDYPGGAANVAVNVKAMGAEVTMLAPLADDPAGAALRQLLETPGVSLAAGEPLRTRSTLVKERLVADGRILMRVDDGSTSPLHDAEAEELYCGLPRLLPQFDVMIISDYGYGAVTPWLIRRVSQYRHRCAGLLAIDSKQLRRFAPLQPTVVKPNFRQALSLLGDVPPNDVPRATYVAQNAERILGESAADIAAVTLDCDGEVICPRGASPYRTFCRTRGAVHVSGAGDSFLAAFSLALAAGGSTASAAEVASAAAAVAVQKEETAICSREELQQHLSGMRTALGLAEIERQAAEHRARGRRIVLTCGCFDILHRGHIGYLQQAKALGDVLIVGVNSDASIARLKGPGRPINGLEDRLGVLAGMSCVDYLVPFDEDVPYELIKAVRPDVFAKGGDYTRERLPEAELVQSLGGTVEILPFYTNRSTTGIIDRICAKQAQANGHLTFGG